MKIRDITDKITGTFYVKASDKEYCIQVYSDDKTGNIKRADRTVLARFVVESDNIVFYFAKDDAPYEFDYDTHPVVLDENIEAIAKIQHKDAGELFKVFEKINQE
jgi:hypothetical protein